MASSHVLRAVGLSDRQADRTLRIGLGRFTTADEIRRAVARLIDCCRRFGSL
ncbi:MAG: hypothetical protein IT210_25975 [Armatimonadetes bacterium]|nr:hypothetical protein [Armatimonadota bacterium]